MTHHVVVALRVEQVWVAHGELKRLVDCTRNTARRQIVLLIKRNLYFFKVVDQLLVTLNG